MLLKFILAVSFICLFLGKYITDSEASILVHSQASFSDRN